MIAALLQVARSRSHSGTFATASRVVGLKSSAREESGIAERTLLRLVGGLLVGGLLLTLIVTHEHPSGHEDNYPVIFAKYAKSNDWVAVHLIQFAGVLIVLGGLLVLYRVLQLRGVVPVLAGFGAAAAIAAAAAWAALQAVDGVALKHAVDAWASASGPQKAVRYADAQTVRWAEYGMNTYFRLLLGLAVALFGIAIGRADIAARWLGWAGVIGGLAYMASGVAVAYAGFESGFESAVGIVAQLGFLIFAVGLLVTGVRRKDHAVP